MSTQTLPESHHAVWNKGKLVGQKVPLRLSEIWAIRVRLQMSHRIRELALFNLSTASCALATFFNCAFKTFAMGTALLLVQASCNKRRIGRSSSKSLPEHERVSRTGCPWQDCMVPVTCFQAA